MKNFTKGGHLGGSAVERQPSAQGVILESQDRAPHRAPCMEPASPSVCVFASLSLCVSHESINNILKIFFTKGRRQR